MLTLVASVGENIRQLRQQAGYKTQGAFAEALRLPQPRVSDMENNRYGIPETPSLLKIAKLLRVSLDDLLAGVDATYDTIVVTRRSSSDDAKELGVDGKSVQFETVSSQVSHIEQVASGVGGQRHVARTRLSKSQAADVEMLFRETEAIDKIIEHARAIGRLADPLTLFSLESAAALEHATRGTPGHEEVRRTRANGKKRKGGRR